MSNPVFERMRDSRGYATFGPPQGRAERSRAEVPGWSTPSASDLDHLYAQQSATTADTGRLTYDDVVVKTGIVFVAVLAGAAVGWQVPGLALIGAIGGLVLGLVNSFKRNPSPALIVAYTVFEGAFLGAISLMYNQIADGAVWQAVLGTASVFAVSLFLFRSGKVRVTPKFTRWLMFALLGYALFSLINFVLMMTGVLDGFGMRNGPIGVIVGLVAVGLAAASLIVDFDSIKRGVEAGVPAKMAWSAAFGLLVTLIWLYLELLRLVTIISSFGSD
jgi:uncharacterized YccA/Bax inhibitor family protein